MAYVRYLWNGIVRLAEPSYKILTRRKRWEKTIYYIVWLEKTFGEQRYQLTMSHSCTLWDESLCCSISSQILVHVFRMLLGPIASTGKLFAKAQPSSPGLRDWLRSYKEEDHGA